MASLTIDNAGNCAVYVTTAEGKRFPIRLGKMGRSKAEGIRNHLNEIEMAHSRGIDVAPVTRAWLAGVTGKLRARMARAGLCEGAAPVITLDAFMKSYIAERADLKASSKTVLEQARVWLTRYLGADKLLSKVTVSDADGYKTHMTQAGLARATINKRIRMARHFFDVAKRRGLADVNPFQHIKIAATANAERRVFVPSETVAKVIEHAPDVEWKLLIALARWGGVRVPSEPLALKWGDVDFDNKRFIIRASKTAHHEGGGVRVVPMFPELVKPFLDCYSAAPEGSEYVITRYRSSAVNLRTHFQRVIERSGQKPWPKLWQNLRASRATELADQFASHVCAAWLGHTEAIADTFYRSVTDDHFKRATMTPEKSVRETVRNAGAGEVVQNKNTPTKRTEAHAGASNQVSLGAVGFEPTTEEL